MRCVALVALLLVLVLSIPAIAADFSGNWNGMVSTPKGDYPIGFSFKADGGRVEGTMLGTDGTPFKIENGKIEGSVITFAVTLNYPGKSLARTYKGVLNGDEIKFSVDSSGQTSEFVVKRSK
jgi:hypothetical protein